VFITALPQSTAEVEKTFFRLNNNENKLRDCLVVCTLEAINNLIYLFMSKHKVHSMNTHTLQNAGR